MNGPVNIDTESIKNGEVKKKLCCSKYEVSVSGGVVTAASDIMLQAGDKVLLAKAGDSYRILQQTGTSAGTVTIRR